MRPERLPDVWRVPGPGYLQACATRWPALTHQVTRHRHQELSPLPGAMTPWHGHKNPAMPWHGHKNISQSHYHAGCDRWWDIPRINVVQTTWLADIWGGQSVNSSFTPSHSDWVFPLIIRENLWPTHCPVDHDFLLFCLALLVTECDRETLTGDTPGWLQSQPWFRFNSRSEKYRGSSLLWAAVKSLNCTQSFSFVFQWSWARWSCVRVMEFMLCVLRCCAE